MNVKQWYQRFIPNSGGLRESGIELFRIITMLVIVAHHYVVSSGLSTDDYIR